jgi:hypothetical protein
MPLIAYKSDRRLDTLEKKNLLRDDEQDEQELDP